MHRLIPGPVDLATFATTAPADAGSKKDSERTLAALGERLLDLQTKLFAEGKSGGHRQLLLILQGMDTSGKGGVLVHTVGLMDPQALAITAFKAPSPEERAHDFLWRVERAVPQAGFVGVFDRSHYEDVLIQRVRSMATSDEIERRYGAINDFERRLSEGGTTIVKCLLHISAAEQRARLQARLDDPTKFWKYNPGDLDERQLWAEYTEAYEIALERTNTAWAPWHVIPSDSKWYRNVAVATALLGALESMALEWPAAQFDVAAEQARLAADTISETIS